MNYLLPCDKRQSFIRKECFESFAIEFISTVPVFRPSDVSWYRISQRMAGLFKEEQRTRRERKAQSASSKRKRKDNIPTVTDIKDRKRKKRIWRCPDSNQDPCAYPLVKEVLVYKADTDLTIGPQHLLFI